jgi:hypothetical protein
MLLLEKSSQIETLSAANDYIARGLSVIPLKPNSKELAVRDVRLREWKPAPEEVMGYWRDNPNYGVGIVCGKVSGIVMLDIDDEEKFVVALKEMVEKLPVTPTVRTRKGWHLYFRYPANRIVERKDRLNDWGAELRGDGCYVVAPPTEIDGHCYHWVKRNGQLMALGEVPIAECPEWLLDAFGVPFADEQNEHTSAQQSPLQISQPASGKGYTLSDERKRALKAIVVPLWVEGQRHELALGLAGLLAKLSVSQDEALALLREIAKEAGDNEWRDRERALKDTFDRLRCDEQIVGYKRLEEIVGEETAKLIATILPPRKTEGETTSSNSSKRQIGLLTLSEWDERLIHLSQGSWFVEGLLRAGWLLVINARPKVGKSTVSVNLALALAEGKSFLNLPTSPCAVLYIDLERPLETLNRFKTLNAQDNPNIFVPSERMGADMLETLRELIRQAKERTNRPVVVFVDTLGDFIKPALRQRRASINDYDTIAEILQELRNLALELGCAFVFVHHTRKALSEEPTEVDVLGSTAIAGKFDVIAHLQHNKTDAGVRALTAEGNAIAKTILHFTISNDYGLEICEAPAKTKEEQAEREIRRLLEQHREGLPRSEIVGYLQDIGLVDTVESAQKLFSRAVLKLRLQTRREGKRTRYFLPQAEDDSGDNGHEFRRHDDGQVGQDIEFVQCVHRSQKVQQNKAENNGHDNGHDNGHGDGTMSNVPGETMDTMDTMDNISLSNVSNVEVIVGANYGQTPEPMSNIVSIKKTQAGLAFSATMDTMDKLPTVSNMSIVEPLVTELSPETSKPTDEPEPVYETLWDDELVDAETLIAELDATSSDKVRYVDTEQWLDELSKALNKPADTGDIPSLLGQAALPAQSAQLTQPKHSLPKPSLPDHLACLCGGELRLFGKTYKCLRCDSPRPAVCRRCGKALKFIAENRAECLGCDTPYVFDRARRLWLCDEDTF